MSPKAPFLPKLRRCLPLLIALLLFLAPLETALASGVKPLFNPVNAPAAVRHTVTAKAKAPFTPVGKKATLTLGGEDFWPFKTVRGNVSVQIDKPGVATLVTNEEGNWTGYVRAVSVGTAKLLLKSGKKKATVKITVVAPRPTPTPAPEQSTPPVAHDTKSVHRTLSIGTGLSKSPKDTDKITFPMDARNFSDMLSRLSFDGVAPTTRTLSNPTRAEAIKAIRSAFAGATENDVSTLYLMCHGSQPRNGTYRLWIGADGKSVTSKELRNILDEIPGKINLILSCCFSGDVIGKSTDNFASGFVRSFTQSDVAAKSGEFVGKKYRVLCGSTSAQPGWIVYFLDNSAAWCLSASTIARGAGWMYQDTVDPYATEMEADTNGDRQITMREICDYAQPLISRLHREYALDEQKGLTQLCAYPYDDSVIFART